ncbi:hypothetical protein FACS1894187_07230 [Synergistales bacterium]|nr:hypothetical protein FACS1894187_07230 [Synergistales bacterium]
MKLPENVEFTKDEEKFLKSEFGLTVGQVLFMGEDALDKLYSDCAKIEIHEASIAGNGDISERGRIAADTVDTLHGEYDSAEFDAEMAEDD